MPRLFVASGIFPPDSGGPATYLREILPALQERGWEIRVLSYGALSDTTAAQNLDFLHPIQRIPRRTVPWRQLHFAAAAWSELQRSDLIFAQSLDLPLPRRGAPHILRLGGDSLWERARRRGWVARGMGVDAFQEYQGGLLLRALRARRRQKLQRYAKIIVPSHHLANTVLGWGAPSERVRVIENAVTILPEALKLEPKSARAQLGLPPGPLLLTVARLQPWKGVSPSLRALAQFTNLRLIVAGDGPLLEPLKAEAAQLQLGERVHFAGRLDAKTLAIHYRAADYVLLYSGYEGLSHVLLEASGYGTPALASDIPGNRELLRNGENGLLIPYVSDIEAAKAHLATAFHETLKPGRREQLAKGQLLAAERFTHARLVKETDALLRGELRSNNTRSTS